MRNGATADYDTHEGGPKMIVSSGIACGVLLGVIEGVGVLMQRMFAEGNRK